MAQDGFEQTVDYPAGALEPVAVERRTLELDGKEGATLGLRAFSVDAPTLGDDVEIVLGAEEDADVLGRTMRLRRVTTKSSLLPQPQVSWVTQDGVPWRMQFPVPMLGELLVHRTEEAVAKADLEPADLFARSLIVPEGTIDAPRPLRSGRFRVRGPGLGQAFADGVGKRIAERGEGLVVVEADPPDPDGVRGVFEFPYEVEGHERERSPNAWVVSEDEQVRKMAEEAVAGAANAVEVARRIEAHVSRDIASKDFRTGFVSAAEVARERRGDCTEHAVLAAALARAVGLPSRVGLGVVYVRLREGATFPGAEESAPRTILGYPMWTEVLMARAHGCRWTRRGTCQRG